MEQSSKNSNNLRCALEGHKTNIRYIGLNVQTKTINTKPRKNDQHAFEHTVKCNRCGMYMAETYQYFTYTHGSTLTTGGVTRLNQYHLMVNEWVIDIKDIKYKYDIGRGKDTKENDDGKGEKTPSA